MARFIPLFFLALPLVEIAMFIVVGRAIGVFPTLALVLLAAVLGFTLLRRQGLGVLNRMRTNMGGGTVPGQALFDGMLLGVAAVLLIIPGFVGDIFALALLLPAVRAQIYKWLTRNVTVVETTTSYRRHADPEDPHLDAPRTIDLDGDDWQRK